VQTAGFTEKAADQHAAGENVWGAKTVQGFHICANCAKGGKRAIYRGGFWVVGMKETQAENARY